MVDEGLESGDAAMAASAVNGPPSAADVDDQYQRRLREAVLALLDQRQPSLAELVATATITITWVLNDDVRGVVVGDPALFDEFRRFIRFHVLTLQLAGYDDHVISNYVLPHLVLRAAQRGAGIPVDGDGDDDDETAQPYRDGGFGAVPASAAAVRSLEKQTIRAAGGSESAAGAGRGCGITECSICFDEFVDGAQVSVMPCPSRGHKFHPDCIAKWLGISNMCPLGRHELPTTGAYDQ